jgi:AraC-like DNA-binding protein
MRVTFLLPHPALRPHVARYIALDAHCPYPLEQRVAPSGGPVLVVLLEGRQQAGCLHGPLAPMPPAYLLGHLDRAALNVLAGRIRSFMIQFTPTGVYSLLGLSVRELTDKCAGLGAVAGPDLREWAATLAEAPDDAARAVAADGVLLRRLLATPRRAPGRRALATATVACGLIAEAEGCIRVEALAAQLYTTPRTLLRHFEEAVGIPVRSATRISRFLATRRYLERHPGAPWSEVVFRFGYSDQSHLIRDFQRYCGEPPSVFRARQNEARLLTLVGREAGPEPGSYPAEPDA